MAEDRGVGEGGESSYLLSGRKPSTLSTLSATQAQMPRKEPARVRGQGSRR